MTNAKLKHQLVEIIEEERTDWEALLADVDPDRIDEPGVNGNWSFRDVTAHLLAWRDGGIRLLEAEARGEPEPPTPWPAALTGDEPGDLSTLVNPEAFAAIRAAAVTG